MRARAMHGKEREGREDAGPAPLLVGTITGAHGIKGEVKLRSFTDKPEDIAAYGPLYDETGRRFDLAVRARAKGVVIAAIEGIADRNAAESLRGTKLYVPRAALPELERDEFYYADLIGLRAELADGTVVGAVTGVANFGAGDVIEIADGKKTLDLPFTADVVRAVDLAGGRIVVALPQESEAREAKKAKRARGAGRARGK